MEATRCITPVICLIDAGLLPKPAKKYGTDPIIVYLSRMANPAVNPGNEKLIPNEHFSCATSARDMPELFRPVQELLKHGTANTDVQHVATELPYYMIVRLNRKKKLARLPLAPAKPVRASVSSTANSTSFEEELIGNCVRREFWFAIPRHKAQSVYQFLLQWNPEKYGQVSADSKQCAVSGYQYRDDGFLVLDSEADEKLAAERNAYLKIEIQQARDIDIRRR
ncbi:unnamed protein product [Toxocara canis]|uniref:Choline-sulfatase n=1 Tax=Toxocara canis TaxID=6265 RepID=A0A183UQT2_TOXCA|nr:unnamed protein product [Toxocara canis]